VELLLLVVDQLEAQRQEAAKEEIPVVEQHQRGPKEVVQLEVLHQQDLVVGLPVVALMKAVRQLQVHELGAEK